MSKSIIISGAKKIDNYF